MLRFVGTACGLFRGIELGEGMSALLPGIVCGGYTEVIWGLYRVYKDNGKENGNYCIVALALFPVHGQGLGS